MTLPAESVSRIFSDACRPGAAPLTFAPVNGTVLRLGSAASPALVPMSSGVSSIHSAVACVELYGTVVVNVCPRVTFCSVIFQRFAPATTSEMSACMWSPCWIVMLVIAIDGPGMSSHHATYDALPELTSCSVPVWMSVLSPTVQPASMQPPPIPIQSDEDSSPDACWVAVGTVQSPAIELNCLPPCSSVPWL